MQRQGDPRPPRFCKKQPGDPSMISSAQISIYPLRQDRLGPAVETVRAALEAHGLEPQIGSMSTVVVGEASMIFAALRQAFDQATNSGEVVMTVTIANACPIPE
jgi:uncharacterized protein YqgV (UPF0045/DUF77 family)